MLGTVAIMAMTGKSKTYVWRWQERFRAEGVEGPSRPAKPVSRTTSSIERRPSSIISRAASTPSCIPSFDDGRNQKMRRLDLGRSSA
jgi:hypothetical protein